MAIKQISLTDFRSLRNTKLEFHPRFNLVTGDNGAGKTSLLEAINFVSQGRSFKTSNSNEIIKNDKNESVVYALYENHKVGIRRTKGNSEIKVNGSGIKRMSELVSKVPVRALNSPSYELSTAKPNFKREFIDWCLFHVEHHYSEIWLKYRNTLKQRNQMLRDKKNIHLLDYWDRELVDSSTLISDLRQRYCKKIEQLVLEQQDSLVGDLKVRLEYRPGWDLNTPLSEIYKKNRNRELRYGHTLYGVQRDNLRVVSDGQLANTILSRGQVKRLSISLYLAQIKLVQDQKRKPVILLIDDLGSELDQRSIDLIISQVQKLDVQVFITSITRDHLKIPATEDYRLFHVEHGIIRAVSTS